MKKKQVSVANMLKHKVFAVLAGISPAGRPKTLHFLLAGTLTIIAMFVRQIIAPAEAGMPFLTFFPAATLTAILAGFWFGIFTTFVCMALATYFFIPPYGAFTFEFNHEVVWSNVIFFVEELIVCSSIAAMRSYYLDYSRSERAYRQLNEIQTAILDALPANIVLIDKQGVIQAVNRQWEGFAQENNLTRPLAGVGYNYLDVCDSVRGADAHEAGCISEGIRQVLDGECAQYTREYSCHHLNLRRWFRMQAVPLSAGEQRGAVIMHVDITEMHLAEQKLQVREQAFRALAENSPDIIARFDREFRYLYVNAAMEALTGIPVASFIGKTQRGIGVSDDVVNQLHATIGEVFSTAVPTVTEFTHLSLSGTMFFQVRMVPEFDSYDQVESVLAVMCDITLLKNMVNLLHESQERFSSIVSNLPGMVFQMTESATAGRLSFIYINEGIAMLFGVSPDAFMTDAEAIYRHLHPSDVLSFDANRRQSAFELEVWDWEGRICTADQGEKWINLRAMPRRQDDGMMVWDGVMLNITRSKNAEIALAESRQWLRELAAEDEAAREQERKQIAREVHDELGQTLTALRMDISLLRIRFGASDAALLEKVQGMMGLVDRAIQSVRDVAVNLRPAVLDMGVVSALEWLCDEFSEHADIPCALKTSADFFDLDEARAVVVFRIVQESLTNVARYAEASRVEVTIDLRGGDLSVEVRDNGKGFDPAKSSARKSFGLLGMRERAIAIGGNVDIVSAPGQGVVVSVLIPIEQEMNYS